MSGGQHEPPSLSLSLRARASASSLQGAAGEQPRRQLDELDDGELDFSEPNDDIRRERLGLDGPEVQRTVEDDYEELLSMPIAKALQSRRPSQSSLKTYLPSSPSSTSLPSFRDATPSSASRSTSPQPASSIPRPHKSRSVSPDTVQVVPHKRRPSAGPDERAPDWQVLQVAKPNAVRTPSGSLTGTTAVRRPSTKAPAPARTAPVKFPPSHGPPAPTPATDVRPRPRPRAQTQTARTMAPRRSEPLPSTTPRKAPPARLRSVSTTTKRRPLQTTTSRYYDDGDDSEQGPLPPWTSPAVSLYRSQGGRLESSGRPDELVLPAVARKLEAERLQRESQAGLIYQYGSDGTPMGAISVAAQAKQQQQQQQQQQREQVEQQQLPSPPPTPDPADLEPHDVDHRSSRQSSRRQSRQASHAAVDESATTPAQKYATDPAASKEAKLDAPAPARQANSDADSAGCCSCTIS